LTRGGDVMKQRLGIPVVLVVLAFLLLSLPVLAQDFRGEVSGVVKDASGSVLPGVTVTVTNVGTNVTAVAVTDAKGYYQVRHLNSGSYNVEAKLDGFRPVLRKGVTVRVGDVVVSDFSLQAGGVEEVITVTSAPPIIDTTSPVTGQ